ncbi:LytR family transcriptional regulator, partial [Gordonia amicalis]
MSRTSGPDEPEAGDEANRSRRGRRAGRPDDANDRRPPVDPGARDASPPGAHPSLREPRSSDRFVRGRTRLTVRELMEQMNAEEPRTPPADSPRRGRSVGSARGR